VNATAGLRRRARALDALRHRDFRLLFTGQTVSLIGDAAFVTALGWKTFTLAGTAKLGVVLVCQALAVLTTLLIGGALADRLSRRRLMIASDLVRMTAVGALAAVDASGHLTFPLLVAFAVVVGLGDGFFFPAFGGMVPLVVEQPSIASANSLIGVARWSSILIGPAFAGFLYRPLGSAAVFAADACSFLVSAVFVYRTRPRSVETSEREGTVREIAAGGPWELARVSGLEPLSPLYADECHFCYELRARLRQAGRYLDVLAPDQCYGVVG